MSQCQLPPLKNEELLEEFVCDLFNEIEKTNAYQNTDFQTFGVKGSCRKVDILSSPTKTVIQWKVKDLSQTCQFLKEL